MLVSYDSKVDALTVNIQPDAAVARTVTVDDRRNVDLDAFGDVVAIEILFPSTGVQLGDIIDRFGLYDIKDDLFAIADMTFKPTAHV